MASEDKISIASATAAPSTPSSSPPSLTMSILVCEQQMIGYACLQGQQRKYHRPSRSAPQRQRPRSLEHRYVLRIKTNNTYYALPPACPNDDIIASSAPAPTRSPSHTAVPGTLGISQLLFPTNSAGHLKPIPGTCPHCRQIRFTHYHAANLHFLPNNNTDNMPAFIPFKHACRRFHPTHIPDTSGPKQKKDNRDRPAHPVTDDYGLVDLESFQATHDPVLDTPPTLQMRASWSPSPSEEALLVQQQTALKRKTYDGCGFPAAATSPNVDIKRAVSPPTEPTPCNHNGASGSKATTSEGDDATGCKKRVECSGCAAPLQGSTAFACIFPTCEVLVCHPCATLLTKHYDDGGVYGDINELKRKLAMPGTPSDEEEEAVKRPKKITAFGAEWMRKMREHNREKQEFANRWGRSLD